MELITRPHWFIKDELGYDATLIYGDVKDGNGGNVILYSSHPLSGYHTEGDTYFKVLSADEEIVKKSHFELSDMRAYPFPYEHKFSRPRLDEHGKVVAWENVVEIWEKPDKYDAELFGVSGSFAYVGSKETVRFFQPKAFLFREHCGLNNDRLPPDDVALVHEGAHLVYYPHLKNMLMPALGGLVSDKIGADEREEVLSEAFSMVPELMYIEKFHSGIEGRYHSMRSDSMSPVYADAYRIATGNRKEVEDMIKEVKMANKPGF